MTHTLAFLAARAIPGVEAVEDGAYRRVHRGAVLQVDAGADPADPVARRIFDLDADTAAIDAHLAADPVLAPLVAARPGLRSPGTTDAHEILVRAITGQQVSVAGARTTLGRIAAAYGEPVADGGDLTHGFPTPEALAEADPATLGMPRARGAAIVAASRACADGLDPRDREALLALPGVGPWTASYVAMRLGDPDAWMPTDLGVRHALARLPGTPDPDRWRPYRAYAVHHLWASLA